MRARGRLGGERIQRSDGRRYSRFFAADRFAPVQRSEKRARSNQKSARYRQENLNLGRLISIGGQPSKSFVGPPHRLPIWQGPSLPYNSAGEKHSRSSAYWLRGSAPRANAADCAAASRKTLSWVLLGWRRYRCPRSDRTRCHAPGCYALRTSGRQENRLDLFFG